MSNSESPPTRVRLFKSTLANWFSVTIAVVAGMALIRQQINRPGLADFWSGGTLGF